MTCSTAWTTARSQAIKSTQGTAYTRLKSDDTLWISQRDMLMLRRRGWCSLPELVPIDGDHVVVEVDQERLTVKPVGLVTAPENMPYLLRILHKRDSEEKQLVRVKDIVTRQDIMRITGRSESTVRGWIEAKGFPTHVRKFGNQMAWLWPEVADWMRRTNKPVRPKVKWWLKGRTRKGGNTHG